MYRRPKFLEVLLEIRQEMAREADYDVDLFAEMVRGGKFPKDNHGYDLTAGDAEQQAKRRTSRQADKKADKKADEKANK